MSFPVWLRKRLISAVLEPVLSHTEKSCITSYYRQFSTNYKKNHKINNRFVEESLRYLGANYTGFILILQVFILTSVESCLYYDAINNWNLSTMNYKVNDNEP